MEKTRPLSEAEYERIKARFYGPFSLRDRRLFVLGCRTGFRVSELLSLRIRDVWKGGQVLDEVTVSRRYMKNGKRGKASGRTVPLHAEVKEAVGAWIEALKGGACGMVLHANVSVEDLPLFPNGHNVRRALSRIQAYRVLREAYEWAEVNGSIGTHGMRKLFARRIYEGTGRDLVKTQRALGHRNIQSTIHYLACEEADVNAAILAA